MRPRFQEIEELIERIGRNYERIFEQHPPRAEDERQEIGVLDHPLFERARGYKKAADLITATFTEDYNEYNAEMMPAVLFLYRHAIELNLKFIRTLLTERVSTKYAFKKNHDLKTLWVPIESFLKKAGLSFEDGALHYRVARVIEEFNEIDADGQLFRYADSSSPAARNWIRVELPILRLCITEIDLLAFGFHEFIHYFKSQKDGDEEAEDGV